MIFVFRPNQQKEIGERNMSKFAKFRECQFTNNNQSEMKVGDCLEGNPSMCHGKIADAHL